MRAPQLSPRRWSLVGLTFILLFLFSGRCLALAVATETLEQAQARIQKEYADRKTLAIQGDPQAQYLWGLDCIYRQQGTAEDGLNWLLSAAAQGNIEAEATAGMCYGDGLGTAVNAVEAIRLLRDAASKGSGTALYTLGTYSIEGLGPLPKDLQQAQKYFSAAAEKGYRGAQSGLKNVKDLMKKNDPQPPLVKTSP